MVGVQGSGYGVPEFCYLEASLPQCPKASVPQGLKAPAGQGG
jgi:hypothetical protein